MDQALRIIHTSVKPLVEQTEGNLGLFIMATRERRELVSMSLWDSERALEAIERSGFADQQAAKLSAVIANAVTGTSYEVVEAPRLLS
jgi:heme-degrading monooxygenase HmoA